MRISLRTGGKVRHWHVRLRERLAAAGHQLHVTTGSDTSGALDLLLTLEHRLYRKTAALFAPVDGDSRMEDCEPGLVLDVRFDGIAGEHALVGALLARRAPLVEIVDAAGRVLAAGLPAVEAPDVVACGLDHVLARTMQLVITAVRAASENAAPGVISEPPATGAPASMPAFFASTLATKLRSRLKPADARLPPWQLAVRDIASAGVPRGHAGDGAAFRALAHDGRRFQADPFVIEHGGRTCLFFEDFPFATRRGVIAMRELGPDGVWSPQRTVLDEPFHLSYPHLFACEGDVYMLPEASAAGCIRLYRADPFPHRFVPDRVLVDGVETGDATLVLHGGSWWLFATLSGDGGSSWDALGLFHAPHPFGPWTSHEANPVLIDAGAARPAGEMWYDGATLMRVAQDCRDGYGKGLAVCRVDRLDASGFAQTVVSRTSTPAGHVATGMHTLNRGGGFEVTDLV